MPAAATGAGDRALNRDLRWIAAIAVGPSKYKRAARRSAAVARILRRNARRG